MSRTIEHRPAAQSFHWSEDGIACVLDYQLIDNTMRIVHTGVPSEAGGRGIAGDLVQAALSVARANGWKVDPECSYAAAFMRKHTEYNDLLA